MTARNRRVTDARDETTDDPNQTEPTVRHVVKTITAERLADKIDADEQFTLIDTRPSDSFEAWHAPGAENVPYDPDEGLDEAEFDRVSATTEGQQVVAICGKGLTSTPFALELDDRDFEDVVVVNGGMEEWSKVHQVAAVETNRDDLVVRQIQRRAKGCLGYVVGSRETGEGVVIDATRQTDLFAVAAQEAGLTVEHV
ncbi:MAG: rhodanese-like domain-containing protein, partial [Halanaeroarchaeum sp.]